MKKRKLGIRFKKQQAREWGWAMPAEDGAELYDVETGEAFEGIIDLSVYFSSRRGEGPVKADLKIFVAAIDSYERSE